jgi:hypothetical protein
MVSAFANLAKGVLRCSPFARCGSVFSMGSHDAVLRPALDDRAGGDDALAARAQARLRALDAMLGGVAHDLNNALSVVLMNLDVMQQDPVLMGKHGRRINGMLDAMTGASALVRHLLSFSHARRPEAEVVSVAELLPSLVELLQVAIGREVDITVESNNAGPCCVMLDPASFEVAVAHAALQLAATMPGGGALAFDLRQGDPPERQVVLTLAAEPRGPQSVSKGGHDPDLLLVEHFARDTGGHMTTVAEGTTIRRIGLHLPACSETTTV